MTLKYIYNRFHQMKHDYIGETSFVRTCWLWLGWINNAILYGASISDYFAYGFYKLNHTGKQEFITYRRFHKILRKANNQNDIDIYRSKIHFNNVFSDLLGREWLDTKTITAEELAGFLKKHNYFFIKEIMSFRGTGVKRIESNGIHPEEFLKDCLADKCSHYIIEEPLMELDALKEFHPWSVNTLRIVTLYDTQHEIVHIMSATLRVGNNQKNVDNLHFGGIGCNIDIPSGVVTTIGYDTHNNTYIVHPITQKQLVGFKIPYWQECLREIKEAAKRTPTVRYVGWDVILDKYGKCCIIEGNDNADHDLQQLYNKGLWKEYKSILKHL